MDGKIDFELVGRIQTTPQGQAAVSNLTAIILQAAIYGRIASAPPGVGDLLFAVAPLPTRQAAEKVALGYVYALLSTDLKPQAPLPEALDFSGLDLNMLGDITKGATPPGDSRAE